MLPKYSISKYQNDQLDYCFLLLTPFASNIINCDVLLFMENQMRRLVRFWFWIAHSDIVQQYCYESALRQARYIEPIVCGSRRAVLRRRISRITDCGNNARHCGSFWSRPFRWIYHRCWVQDTRPIASQYQDEQNPDTTSYTCLSSCTFQQQWCITSV